MISTIYVKENKDIIFFYTQILDCVKNIIGNIHYLFQTISVKMFLPMKLFCIKAQDRKNRKILERRIN